jgi:hypothetical protein
MSIRDCFLPHFFMSSSGQASRGNPRQRSIEFTPRIMKTRNEIHHQDGNSGSGCDGVGEH